MTCLDLVAFRRRLAHHLDGDDDLAQVQKADLLLFQSSFGDLRSVVSFRPVADLVGGAVDLLAKHHIAPLQDCREPMREGFDFRLEAGPAQLPEQGLEGLPDEIVLQDVILGFRNCAPFSVSPNSLMVS